MITRNDAILNLVSGNLSFKANGTVDYIDGQTPPTEEAIQVKLSELQADYESKSYARARQKEYPTTDYLIVALWEKVIEGRSESADALEVKRQEVKTAHPKPE